MAHRGLLACLLILRFIFQSHSLENPEVSSQKAAEATQAMAPAGLPTQSIAATQATAQTIATAQATAQTSAIALAMPNAPGTQQAAALAQPIVATQAAVQTPAPQAAQTALAAAQTAAAAAQTAAAAAASAAQSAVAAAAAPSSTAQAANATPLSSSQSSHATSPVVSLVLQHVVSPVVQQMANVGPGALSGGGAVAVGSPQAATTGTADTAVKAATDAASLERTAAAAAVSAASAATVADTAAGAATAQVAAVKAAQVADTDAKLHAAAADAAKANAAASAAASALKAADSAANAAASAASAAQAAKKIAGKPSATIAPLPAAAAPHIAPQQAKPMQAAAAQPQHATAVQPNQAVPTQSQQTEAAHAQQAVAAVVPQAAATQSQQTEATHAQQALAAVVPQMQPTVLSSQPQTPTASTPGVQVAAQLPVIATDKQMQHLPVQIAAPSTVFFWSSSQWWILQASGLIAGLTFAMIVKALCVAGNVLVQVSPLPQVRRWEFRGCTGEADAAPYVSIAFGGWQWCFYGLFAWLVTARSGFLILVHSNCLGAVLGTYYVWTFYRNCRSECSLSSLQKYLSAVAALVFLQVCAMSVLPAERALFLTGLISSFCSFIGATSVLVTLPQVLRTKDSRSIPGPFCCANFGSSLVWSLCGWLLDDPLVMVPNLFSTCCAMTAISCKVLYPSSEVPEKEGREVPCSIEEGVALQKKLMEQVSKREFQPVAKETTPLKPSVPVNSRATFASVGRQLVSSQASINAPPQKAQTVAGDSLGDGTGGTF